MTITNKNYNNKDKLHLINPDRDASQLTQTTFEQTMTMTIKNDNDRFQLDKLPCSPCKLIDTAQIQHRFSVATLSH